MNIVELVKNIVQEFPRIDDIHLDSLRANAEQFGLYPTGDKLINTDVLGNETREHTFIFYAVFQSFNDYDRLINSGFLLELQSWLEHYDKAKMLKKLTCSNGMLYDIPDENTNSGVQYQLQITATYKIESEE